jgi:hypothetical protein
MKGNSRKIVNPRKIPKVSKPFLLKNNKIK